jgi:N-acetylglucosamine-6-phosphate deacetylase
MKIAFTNARIFTGEAVLDGPAVLTEAGTVVGLAAEVPDGYATADLRGLSLAPGLVDLQVYGGQGRLFTTEPTPEAIAATHAEHRRGGTTHFQITYHTAPLAGMIEAADACRRYLARAGAGLLGLHLEGPYFNPAKRGAHLARYVRVPDETELQTLLDATAGLPTFLTLAPELLPEALLETLLNSPIRLSAGHSGATYRQAKEAFSRGIGLVTHLFNAMSPLESRAPGLVGAAFDSSAHASIIVDGIHVDYAAVRIARRVMGERLFLITDAVTEDPRGAYPFRFNQERQRFEDEAGTLSGSALTMMEAVRNTVQHVGLPLDEALRMASTVPARLVGQGGRLGRVAPGYEASFVLFDDALTVHGVVERGYLERFANAGSRA